MTTIKVIPSRMHDEDLSLIAHLAYKEKVYLMGQTVNDHHVSKDTIDRIEQLDRIYLNTKIK